MVSIIVCLIAFIGLTITRRRKQDFKKIFQACRTFHRERIYQNALFIIPFCAPELRCQFGSDRYDKGFVGIGTKRNGFMVI